MIQHIKIKPKQSPKNQGSLGRDIGALGEKQEAK